MHQLEDLMPPKYCGAGRLAWLVLSRHDNPVFDANASEIAGFYLAQQNQRFIHAAPYLKLR